MPTLSQFAAQRGEALFGCDEYDRPADIIADMIQYCLQSGEDFEEELAVALQYVTEEQGVDEEFP
jgi:hypothetical protein